MQPAAPRVPFPPALRDLISQHHLRENEIAEVFKDRNVLNTYHQWCQANRLFAESNPAIRQISQVADRIAHQAEAVAEVAARVIQPPVAPNPFYQFLDQCIDRANRGAPMDQQLVNYWSELLFEYSEIFFEALRVYHETGLLSGDQICNFLKINNQEGNSVFHDVAKVRLLVPLLKDINVTNEQLLSLLRLQNQGTFTPLHYSTYIVDELMPLMQKLNNEQILIVLKIRGGRFVGPPITMGAESLKSFIPLMERLTQDELIGLLRELGVSNVLGSEERLRHFLPLMANLTAEKLFEFFNDRDRWAALPLDILNRFEILIPIMERLNNVQLFSLVRETLMQRQRQRALLGHSVLRREDKLLLYSMGKLTNEQLVEIFKNQSDQGHTLLENENDVEVLIPLLEKLTKDQLLALLKNKNRWGWSPGHYSDTLIRLIPVMEKAGVTKEELIDLLTLKTEDGRETSVVHFIKLRYLGALINKFGITKDQLSLLLKIKDGKGFTPLAYYVSSFPNIPIPQDIVEKFTREEFEYLLNIENDEGISAGAMLQELSDRWLFGPKAALQARQPMSENEYDAKMEELGRKLDQLRARIVFGNEPGQVNPIILMKKNNREERWTVQEFDAALAVMRRKIKNREAWLGTPPERERAKLLTFYSEMLSDFTVLADELLKKDKPDDIAGFLVWIVKTELDQRCAAAYKAEINQAAMILSQTTEQRSFPAFVKQRMEMILLSLVEEISRVAFGGNVHEFTQLQYSVGLASEPDPLHHFPDIEVYKSAIKARWAPQEVVGRFVAAMRQAPRELRDLMVDWFKEGMPEAFDVNNCKERYATAVEGEKQISEDFRRELGNLNDNQKTRLLAFLTSPQGVKLQRLPLSDGTKQTLTSLKADNLARYNELVALTEGEEIENFFRENDLMPRAPARENLADRRKRLESQKKDFQALAFQNARMKKIKEILGAVDDRTMEEVDAKMKEFDENMRALGKGLNVDYHATGLPSTTIDQERRLAFAEQFYTERGELRGLGATRILQSFGLIER